MAYTQQLPMGDNDKTKVTAPPARPSRRRFLSKASVMLGGVVVALSSVPVLGAFLTPLFRKKKDDGDFIHAIALNKLQVGVPKRVDLVSTVVDGWTKTTGVVGAAWLLKRNDSSVTALSTVCPHSGCSINLGKNTTLFCPCHDSAFDYAGTPLSGPSPRSLDPLEVQIRDEQVYVRYVRYKQGIKERQEI